MFLDIIGSKIWLYPIKKIDILLYYYIKNIIKYIIKHNYGYHIKHND